MNWWHSLLLILIGIVTPHIILYAVIGITGCMTGDFIGKTVLIN